jgi:hypothetical protein
MMMVVVVMIIKMIKMPVVMMSVISDGTKSQTQVQLTEAKLVSDLKTT